MDSLFHHKDKPTTTTGTTPDHHKTTTDHQKPSNSELLSSAKLIAEAASGKPVDKSKMAGAAADLLDAAATYGKLDESQGLGKYMDKAENYLHQYHTSHTTTTTKTDPAGHKTTEITTTTTDSTAHPDGEKKHGGHGYGDVMKLAEGMLKRD